MSQIQTQPRGVTSALELSKTQYNEALAILAVNPEDAAALQAVQTLRSEIYRVEKELRGAQFHINIGS